MREQRVDDGPDRSAARIAARQHGVVSVQQLRAAGLDRSAIGRRVAAARLHRIHRGVYAVGHPGLSREGMWMAAVLACGDGAALSHRSAAELWRLLEAGDGPAHVSVPVTGGRRTRVGVRVHRRPSLGRRDKTRHRGVPVTTPSRTLADLHAMVGPGELRRAIREAEFRRLPIGPEGQVADRAASELELVFLRLCRRSRLPEPELNVRVGSVEVDFFWRSSRVIVETDGYRSHAGRQAFEDDRRRDNELAVLGYRVFRFTYSRVLNEPADVIATVRAALSLGGQPTR
jgi:very-short-patch-repair endonuclease